MMMNTLIVDYSFRMNERLIMAFVVGDCRAVGVLAGKTGILGSRCPRIEHGIMCVA